MQKINSLKDDVELYNKMHDKLEEAAVAASILNVEDDSAIKNELYANIAELNNLISLTEEKLLLSEPYDNNPAIVNIHPGAGGTESHDWVEMLLRM